MISAVTHLPQDPFAQPRTRRQHHSPVQFEFVGQHPPVVAPGLGGVQAAAKLLPDGEGDAESAGPYYGGDGVCGVHGRVIDASRFLRLERKKNKQTIN